MYVYMLEVGGVIQPGNRFVSFVRASGRGEAKLRERAGGDVLCVARAQAGPVTSSSTPSTSLRAGLSRWLSRRLFRAGVVPLVVPWDLSCQSRAG